MSYLANTDYFTLFGLPRAFLQDKSDIKLRYHQLQQKAHPDNFISATPSEKRVAVEYAATINEAYRTLTSPLKRAIYLLKLHGVDVQSETDTSMPMDFLMEQMELRERLSIGETIQVKNEVELALNACVKQMSELLDSEQPQLSAAREGVRKMQFYVRLSEEIAELKQS